MGQLDERFVNKIIYFKLPASSASQLGGKPWLKLDPSALTTNGSNPLGSLGSNNPAAALAQLKTVGDVTRIGMQTIDGVPTEHFHATIDLLKAADKANFNEATKKQLIKAYGPSGKEPEDIWIDQQGQVRRVTSSLRIASGSTTGSGTFQGDYYDFGQADTSVAVAPPASQTTDYTAYLKKLGSSQTS